jgi:hypothetical protein
MGISLGLLQAMRGAAVSNHRCSNSAPPLTRSRDSRGGAERLKSQGSLLIKAVEGCAQTRFATVLHQGGSSASIFLDCRCQLLIRSISKEEGERTRELDHSADRRSD